jgi:hypothetical protein
MLVAIRVTWSKGLLVLELGKDGGGTSETTHALDVDSHMLTQIPKIQYLWNLMFATFLTNAIVWKKLQTIVTQQYG